MHEAHFSAADFFLSRIFACSCLIEGTPLRRKSYVVNNTPSFSSASKSELPGGLFPGGHTSMTGPVAVLLVEPCMRTFRSMRSRRASGRRSFVTESHSTLLVPRLCRSLMVPEIVRPLPTPAPSPRKKPFLAPSNRRGPSKHC